MIAVKGINVIFNHLRAGNILIKRTHVINNVSSSEHQNNFERQKTGSKG